MGADTYLIKAEIKARCFVPANATVHEMRAAMQVALVSVAKQGFFHLEVGSLAFPKEPTPASDHDLLGLEERLFAPALKAAREDAPDCGGSTPMLRRGRRDSSCSSEAAERVDEVPSVSVGSCSEPTTPATQPQPEGFAA